jgi:mRNA interferase MazF
MKRGEVRWYTFAPPDKRRPVLLLTREPMLSRLNDVTVASITSTIRNLDSEVCLSVSDGMPHDCVINCDQIQTLPRHKMGDRITILSSVKLDEVERAILFALGFRPHK